jgi:hypothetical protein
MKLAHDKKFLIRLALGALGYGLLAYAASRTLEFVQATMPANKQWMGYLFLLATGVGALIWHGVYLNDAKGPKQRGLSFGLAIADLLMEFVLVYADTMRESSANGLLTMTQEDLRLFILASVGAVALNAAGWFFYKLFDPDKEQEQKAADFADDIEAEAMKILSTPEARKQMIQSHAPQIQSAIMARVTENVAARFTAIPADPTMPILAQDKRLYEQSVSTIPHPTTPLGMWNPNDPNDSPFKDHGNAELRAMDEEATLWKQRLDERAKEKAAGYPDNYGPLWQSSTDVTPTLDAYAWACQHCKGTNAAHTRQCQWCHEKRTNSSPTTAFANTPPAQKDEPSSAPNPFQPE